MTWFAIPLDPTKILGGLAKGAGEGAVGAVADAVAEAVGKAVAALSTLWVSVGTPNLTTTGGQPSESVAFIQNSLWWYMAAAAVFAVIVGGARMAWEGRQEPGRELLKALLTLVVVSGAGLTVIAVATNAADEFAKWIIQSSVKDGDFGKNITVLLGLSGLSGPIGPMIVIIVGLGALLASLLQIVLMVMRGGMLVLLAGILPLSAAFSNTETGRTWLKKGIAWTVAFILYKPAAAIVYATAFKLAGSDVFGKGNLVSALTGLTLMVLALFTLPALMRFVMPAVGAVAAGGGGGGSMGAAAAMAMPTGAMSLGGGGNDSAAMGTAGSNGSSGGQGDSGASGAVGTGGDGEKGSSGAEAAQGAAGGAEAAGGGAEAGAGAGAGAAGAGAGAAGAGAAAGGPAGAAAAAGLQAAKGAKDKVSEMGESQTGDQEGGPSGSR